MKVSIFVKKVSFCHNVKYMYSFVRIGYSSNLGMVYICTVILNQKNIMDIAKRSKSNPLLRPDDLQAGINGMEIT